MLLLPIISDGVGLRADKLSLRSTGHLHLADQAVDFEQAGDFDLQIENMRVKLQTGTPEASAWLELNSLLYTMQGQLNFDLSMSEPDSPVGFIFDGPVTATYPVINLPGDEHARPMTITADEMSIIAGLTSDDGKLFSTGSGTFISGQVSSLATSAAITDINWQQLDLINLAGELSTKTQGFATELEGETWTGFDFDIIYTLLSTSDVKGSGNVMFDSGLEIPIAFAGNTQAEHWEVSLPASTIKLSQLASLLRVAHVEIPESVKLTDGYIDIQGDVLIGDEITAKMAVSGYEMGASMLESSAREAGFTFDTTYGKTISAKGSVSVKTLALPGGIDVSQIRADLNLESKDTFGLNNLYAEIFDGRLNLSSLRFAENRIEDTTLELTHISLGHMLEFADVDGLDGTGFLDIALPTGSDETGVYIRNGTFNATAPVIWHTQKRELSAAISACRHWKTFNTAIFPGQLITKSDGAYQIAIRLEGKNPDLYGGHPIVFNLNITDSLPELFEAMFITGDFEEGDSK